MNDIAAAIPKTSATVEAIYRTYEEKRKAEKPRAYLGASIQTIQQLSGNIRNTLKSLYLMPNQKFNYAIIILRGAPFRVLSRQWAGCRSDSGWDSWCCAWKGRAISSKSTI